MKRSAGNYLLRVLFCIPSSDNVSPGKSEVQGRVAVTAMLPNTIPPQHIVFTEQSTDLFSKQQIYANMNKVFILLLTLHCDNSTLTGCVSLLIFFGNHWTYREPGARVRS